MGRKTQAIVAVLSVAALGAWLTWAQHNEGVRREAARVRAERAARSAAQEAARAERLAFGQDALRYLRDHGGLSALQLMGNATAERSDTELTIAANPTATATHEAALAACMILEQAVGASPQTAIVIRGPSGILAQRPLGGACVVDPRLPSAASLPPPPLPAPGTSGNAYVFPVPPPPPPEAPRRRR